MAIQPSVNHPIDCGLATTSIFARQFAKQLVSEKSVDIFALPSMRGVDSPTGVTTEIIGDINYEKETFATSVSDCDVSVSGPTLPLYVKSIKSLNSNILSNPTTQNPLKLTYQSTGSTGIELELSNGERSAIGFTTYAQVPSPVYVFQNHLNGSLAKHIYSQVSSIADGTTSSPSHYQIYSTFDQTNNVFVKNSGFWGSELDFSGVSVNKAGSGGITGVVMVTPRHAIGAAHYAPPADPNGGPLVGDKIYFCDSNNNTIERTVVATQNAVTADSRIVKFDSDVPASVKKYKLPPSNWRSYLPRDFPITSGFTLSFYYASRNVPMVVMSHYRWDDSWPLQRSNRYAYIYSSFIQWAVTPSGDVLPASLVGGPASSSYFGGQFNDYNGQPSGIQGGDSGFPCFYVVNGDLIFCMKHLSPAAGSFLGDALTAIQNAIDFVGSEGYSLQSPDLSGFTDFSS
jgi:hypothetical protein